MSLQLQIENTSTCNAGCTFCPYPQSKRWGGVMDRDLYWKILQDAADVPLVTQITITGLGEPTLDPHLLWRVEQARKAKPDSRIDLFTNGVYMTPDRFDSLRNAGIDGMTFSLNAVNADQHREVMKLDGKFDTVCSNLDYALENRGSVHIEIHAVEVAGWSKEDTVAFYRRWGHVRMGGHGQMIREGNWTDRNTRREFKPNEYCFRATTYVYVLYDGRVSACCFDPTGKMTFGDLRTQSLREVYNSEPYVKFREAHFEDRADEYDICAKCTRI